MADININEYVRTKNQGIFIISHINIDFDDNDFRKVCICQNKKVAFTNIDTIKELKHNPSIIDLIEVGDILQINKEKYEVVYDRSYNKLGLLIPNREKLGIRHCSLQYIFSKQGISEFKNIRVVTKEQFSNIEYRLEN